MLMVAVRVEVAMSDVPLSVGDAARELGVRPARITQLFYERRLRDDLCPIVSGRRLIPRSYLRVIAMQLRGKGLLPPLEERAE